MYLGLYDFVGTDGSYNTSGSGMKQLASIPFPTGQWVHLEAYYDWSTAKTGSVVAYQDGVEVLRQMDAITLYSGRTYDKVKGQFGYFQWAVNNYGGKLNPSPYALYIDDAAISTRLLRLPAVGRATTTTTASSTRPTTSCGARTGRLDAIPPGTPPGEPTSARHSGGSGSGASANAAVPEPATLVLLMFAAAGWCLRRRRAA